MDIDRKKYNVYQAEINQLNAELIYLTRDWTPHTTFRARAARDWKTFDRLSEMEKLIYRINEAKLYNLSL